LGEKRSSRELLAGSFLAGILVLIRENMVLILPILFLYILWQHGKRASLILLGIVTFLLVVVHIIYWPGIMEVWDRWIPNPVRPFFSAWVYEDVAKPLASPLSKKLFIIFNSVQANFMAVFSVLAVWLGWPKGGFKNPTGTAQFKMIVFLSAIFIELYVAHGIASLGKDYCAFCLVNYVTFFSPAGLLILFAFLPGIKERRPLFPVWLAAALILLLTLGIGYSNAEKFGAAFASIQLPRMTGFSFQSGNVEVWRLIANKFNVSFQFVRTLLPSLAGLAVGILLLVLGWAVTKIGKNKPVLLNPVYALVFVTMLTGLALSPTIALGGVSGVCDKDIIAGYEQVGAELKQRIPAGAQVYWMGDASPTPLLYLSDIKIYPPQLNAFFSLKPQGNSDRALKYGFWTSKLDQKWRAEADVFLIRESELASMQATLSPGLFDELEPTSPTYACVSDSRIHIFKRK
jgi:hypothetical protein